MLRFLLANDDGIYAPGLAAMERELRKHGEVQCGCAGTEQSGVGHSITYLTPCYASRFPKVSDCALWVEGSPADCVKLE